MTTLSFYELQQIHIVSGMGLDPFSWYKQMRTTDPVSVDEQNRLCELFRYEEVRALLADPLLFSSRGMLTGVEEGEEAERGSIMAIDPPRHNKLRALVAQAFTPRAIAKLTDTIRGIVNELLDASTTSGTLDVIRDLSLPLAMRVISRTLGVPLTQQADFERWIADAIGTSPEKAVAAWEALEGYMHGLLAQKRKEREDDLISTLLDAEVDGELLSDREIVGFCVLLLGTGFEPVQYFIGNLFLCLDEHPAARAQLWADPSLIPGTHEEVLRFRPVIHRIPRRVTRDTEICGKPLKAGYWVFAWLASANRDEEQWSNPEVFDIQRSPNPHLGSGSGIHTCLGAPLARLEAKIALEQIIERFKDVQRIQEAPLQFITSYHFHGLQHLPVRVYKR